MFGCSISPPCLVASVRESAVSASFDGSGVSPTVRLLNIPPSGVPSVVFTRHKRNFHYCLQPNMIRWEILKTRFEYHGARLRVTRRGRRHPSLREARWHQAEQPAGAWHAGDPLPSAHRAARPPQPRLHPILRRATLSCGCAATPTSAATATCAATPYPAPPP